MKTQIHENAIKEARTQAEKVVKLPYQKPELHEISLSGTEGKLTAPTEASTVAVTIGPS